MQQDFKQAVELYRGDSTSHTLKKSYYMEGLYTHVIYDFMERIRIIRFDDNKTPAQITPFRDLDRDLVEALHEKLRTINPDAPSLPGDEPPSIKKTSPFNKNNGPL